MNSTSYPSSEHKTEVWYGGENIVRKSLEVMCSIEKQYDLCIAQGGLRAILSDDRIRKAYYDLKTRGVTVRIITEITKSSSPNDYRIVSEIAEIRHLSGMNGNFVVADEKSYAAVADLNDAYPHITELIHSTVPAFVKQQQQFFSMLWDKAIPAEQRITEIEEGVLPDVLEILRNPSEIINIGYRLVSGARDEILIIFHTTNALLRQERAGGLKLLIENADKYKTRIKILVPIEAKVIDTVQRLEEIKGIEVRNIESAMQTRMTILVIDRAFSLVVELKDDTKDDPKEAIGLATYSNSKSTVLSYASIFDTLWKQCELREELLIRSMAQKEFINIAAHELRNPIQPILGLSDILLRSDVSLNRNKNNEIKQKEIIEIIARNARRLQRLTEDILDITKIESKTLKLNKNNFIFSEVIREIVQGYTAQLGNSGKSINFTFSSTSPKLDYISLFADQERIKQVLCNLIDNAIKFTQEGEIAVATEIDDGLNQIIVKVKDTGRGIDSDILSKLFTKFVTKSDSGTGLGLYICKGIIEAHGGRIWAENNSDHDDGHANSATASCGGSGEPHGATFSFSLPLTHP